jgi:2-(3-amino-3-carboxypropyl)histidine synthase
MNTSGLIMTRSSDLARSSPFTNIQRPIPTMEADTREQNIPGAFPDIPEPDGNHADPTPPPSRAPRRKFIGRRTAEAEAKQKAEDNGVGSVEETTAIIQTSARRPRPLNQIPPEILHDPAINAAIALLPANYSFEIHKTIHRIRSLHSQQIALQFPEGLLLFATTISDILTTFCPGTTYYILGDVTYGACCIDDYTARALNCDLLIHYAHSCLIPISKEKIATLYIFVDISIDESHLLATITRNFPPGRTIAMVSTVQFNSTLHTIRPRLEAEGLNILIPQIAPLSKGEVLGCTAPRIGLKSTKSPLDTSSADALLYLGDGRFHLEAAMIASPTLPAYRYDPYSRTLTSESYDHPLMLTSRSSAMTTACTARKWGLILGALGRQGNPHTMTLIENHLTRKGIPFINLLLSEIFPGKLAMFSEVEAWVQIACPRLSIDWGHAFERPLLTPWEALVVLGGDGMRDRDQTGKGGDEIGEGEYPMDYYAGRGLGRVTEKSAKLDMGEGPGGGEVEVV